MKSQTLLLVIALYIIYRLATRTATTPPDTEPRSQTTDFNAEVERLRVKDLAKQMQEAS